MDQTEIVFNLQMTMGLVFWAIVAWFFVLPKLYTMPFTTALLLPLTIAALRFHGMNFLVHENNAGLAEAFAKPAAYGDLAVCLIAILAAVLIKLGVKSGVYVAWAYGVLGALDFANGFYLGDANDMPFGVTTSMRISVAVPRSPVPDLFANFTYVPEREHRRDPRREHRPLT